MKTIKKTIHLISTGNPVPRKANVCLVISDDVNASAPDKFEDVVFHELWIHGYFCCTIGEASQRTIEKHIANQG